MSKSLCELQSYLRNTPRKSGIKNFKKLVIRLLNNTEKHLQEFNELKEYVTQVITTLKQKQTKLLEMDTME